MPARGVPFTVPAKYLALLQGCILYPSLAPVDREEEKKRERERDEGENGGLRGKPCVAWHGFRLAVRLRSKRIVETR